MKIYAGLCQIQTNYPCKSHKSNFPFAGNENVWLLGQEYAKDIVGADKVGERNSNPHSWGNRNVFKFVRDGTELHLCAQLIKVDHVIINIA